MEDELAKLPPGDEVAIMAMDMSEDEERFWLTQFTNDRATIAAALARVPALCGPNSGPPPEGVERITATVQNEVKPGEGKPEDVIKRLKRSAGARAGR